MKMQDADSSKKLAVITGASSGIGYELAKQFAQNGFDLLVVAEDDGIETAANDFRELGTQVESVQLDLAVKKNVEEFYHHITEMGRPVDSLVLNAGVGVGGASFDKTDLEAEFNLIRLNVFSTVHLTKLVLKDMIARGDGKILFTSSVASIMPGPYESIYSASKAFVQSFAMAIREEVKDKGITVTSLMPGPTETNFFHRAGMDDTKVADMKKDDPAEVAKQGFDALMEGRDHVIAGSLMNNVQTTMAKMAPQTVAAKMHKSMTKPNSPSDR